MAVTSAANINCAYPAQQNMTPNLNTCAIKNSQSFKGAEEAEVQKESPKEVPQEGKSKKNWIIGGLIAAVGVAALVVFKKNIFKNDTPLKKLIKNIEQQDIFDKGDFVDYVKENHAKIEDFKKSFVMKLDNKFKTAHNLKGANNLLLLGYYAEGKVAPIFTKIVDCEKIGKNLKSLFDKIDMGIFKGKKAV